MTDFRLKTLYSNPAFWHGAKLATDNPSKEAFYTRLITQLETGKPVDQIPEFLIWQNTQVKRAAP